MQRECPGWVEEMEGRGVRLLGRELDLPETAATVRVRDGETLVTDGPFAETKEFMAGFDVIECADLDEAIEVAAKHPSSWFQTIEIRPFTDGLALGEEASAFGRGEDGRRPVPADMWMGGTSAAPFDDQAVMRRGRGLAAGPGGPRRPRPWARARGHGDGHDGPRPRRPDAAQRRAVHRDQGVHRRHRRRQLRRSRAGDRARGGASARPVPRDRGAPVL